MSQTIFVTAELRMNAGQPRATVIQAVEQFCLDMQSEDGCLQAMATYDDNMPQRVILWECYENREAIEAHFTMAHTRAFIASEMTELVQAFETQPKGAQVS